MERVDPTETFMTVSKYHKGAAGHLMNYLPPSAVRVSGRKGAPAAGALCPISQQPLPSSCLAPERLDLVYWATQKYAEWPRWGGRGGGGGEAISGANEYLMRAADTLKRNVIDTQQH